MTRFRIYSVAILPIMVGALVMTACTATSGPPTAPGEKDTKPYGSLTVGYPLWQSDQLDPAVTTFGIQHQITSGAIFDSLVDLDPADAQPRPAIAERWEIAKDGMTHTFYIRKGVKFHNGDDLTGADVKFSVERILAPDSVHNFAPSWRGSIASVELKDDYTVVVHMKAPRFDFLDGIANWQGVSAVVPKKYIEEKGVDYFRKNPVGSGPWKFVSYEIGNKLVLEAVENHWRAVPKFKNLTILQISNASTMVAMLKTGELDIGAIQLDAAAGLKAAGLRMVDWDAGSKNVAYLFWDLDHPESHAFGDVRVRKAMSLAVDRKALADNILGGYGEPSPNVSAVSRYAYFYDSNVLKPDPYDPEQAKRLIAEAGHPNGFKMKAWDRGQGGNTESMFTTAYVGYWRKVGIDAELVPADYAGVIVPLFRPVVKPALYDTLFTASGTGATGFENFATGYHSKKSSLHNTRNLKLDELIDKVPLTWDPAEKKRLALEAALLANNEYSNIAYVFIRQVVAIGPKVGTLTPIKGISGLAPSFEKATHAK